MIWMECIIPFVEVDIEKMKPGDEIFYIIPKTAYNEVAHGPFTLHDPKTHTLINSSGVRISFKNHGLVYYVPYRKENES